MLAVASSVTPKRQPKKVCTTTVHQEALILYEYMCRRRQRGVKQDEWVNGLDFFHKVMALPLVPYVNHKHTYDSTLKVGRIWPALRGNGARTGNGAKRPTAACQGRRQR